MSGGSVKDSFVDGVSPSAETIGSPGARSTGAPKVFQSLQVGRGVAALLVVLYHAGSAIFPAQKYWHSVIAHGMFDFAYSGVDFFFVLSGFIIAYMHTEDISRPDRIGFYIMRRTLRIYPVYWVVMLAVALVSKPTMLQLIPAILLVGPVNEPTVLTVAWTLFHEIAFYAVFATWVVSRRLGMLLSAAWLLAITAGLALGTDHRVYILRPINLTFLLGIAAWWLSSHGRVHRPMLWAAVGAASLVGLALEFDFHRIAGTELHHLLFGAASAVTIAGLVTLERQSHWQAPAIAMLLGSASYSIYLVHYPVLAILAKIAVRTGLREEVPLYGAFVILVAATLGAGIAFHYVVERRLLVWTGLQAVRRRAPLK